MFASTAVVAAALALITHAGVGWLIRPLSSLARAITSLTPNRPGERLKIDGSAPHEAEVITFALNDYLQRIDEFVAREREFVNMASHELRTPIAVISGAAEVALDDRADRTRLEAHLAHIARTTRDMERLITLLLALAKDPVRLRAAADTVDLRALVPTIVRDHAFLAQHKDLAFRLDIAAAATIRAPEQVARAAIGNLVRNAVENSDRGTIDVTVNGSQVIVEDPGHGMSNEELSALYTRLARAGHTPASTGIGLELITRLCDHLGWRLSFSSVPRKGTRAVLEVGAP
jgi:signal transduction histidine kinase